MAKTPKAEEAKPGPLWAKGDKAVIVEDMVLGPMVFFKGTTFEVVGTMRGGVLIDPGVFGTSGWAVLVDEHQVQKA